MGKIIPGTLAAIALFSALSYQVHAADLEGDMMNLSQGLNLLMTSNDATAMHQALIRMRHAAEDAKQATPPSLAGSAAQSEAMIGWRRAFDRLLAQFDATDRLVLQGNLAAATASAQQIATLRNQNHRLYR